MKIVFMGNNERGCLCLEAVVHAGHQVVGVVALPDDQQPDWSRNVATVAGELGIPVHQPRNVNESGFVDILARLNPELIVLAGYNQLLGRPIIELPSQMCINLHAGPLPYYRGAAPLNWMLVNGESRGGISICKVDEGIDTGDILAQEFFDITPEDDYATLLDQSLRLYPPMLVQTIEQIERGSIRAVNQDRSQGSFYTKRYPQDGWIDWRRMTAIGVNNLVRSLVCPMPGAFTTYGDETILIEKTRLIKTEYRGVPGRIAAHWPSGVVVVCADKGLLVTRCRTQEGEVVAATEILPRSGRDLG